MGIEELYDTINELIDVDIVVDNIAKYTTMGVGGRAVIVSPDCRDDIANTIDILRNHHIDYFILGNGSNIIAGDKDFDDVVFVRLTQKYSRMRRYRDTIICEAGLSLMRLISRAASLNLGGMEKLFGIPGTIGGAVYMNAGSYGSEIKDHVRWVEVYHNGRVYKMYKDRLKFGYRTSIFKDNEYVILRVAVKLEPKNKNDILSECRQTMQKRVSSQPYSERSAGSVFKKFNGVPAPILIEQCALKGMRVGDAMISDKHCGFIVNVGRAKFCEVVQLIGLIQKTVQKKFDILLEVEPIIMGE